MSTDWYVLQSKTGKESFVLQYIQERGHEAYFPHVNLRQKNRRAMVTRAYLPGYLFVRADLTQVGESFFRYMPNAVGLVTFGETPAQVPHSVVSSMQQHLEHLNPSGSLPYPPFHTGEQVVIRGGPFEGYNAIFDRQLSGQERVRVLLQLLGQREIRLTLHRSQIQKSTHH